MTMSQSLILLGCSGHVSWIEKERRLPVHWEEFWSDAAGNLTGRIFVRLMPGEELATAGIPELKRRIHMIVSLNDRPQSTGYEIRVAALDIPDVLLSTDWSDLPVRIARVGLYVQPTHSPDAKVISDLEQLKAIRRNHDAEGA